MVNQIEYQSLRKLMKIYKQLFFIFCLLFTNTFFAFGQYYGCKDHLNNIVKNTQIDCLQGVYQIINDNNPETENYQITSGYKYLIIYLSKKPDKKNSLDEFNLGYHGFINQEIASNKQNLNICDLQPDENTYISISEGDIDHKGQIAHYYENEEFYCEAGFVEYFTRKLMFKEKLSFLPFQAYKHIKHKASTDQRDYITEFDILNKLKKAKVTTERAYFHNDQDKSSMRNAYVIKKDQVIIDKIEKDWVKAAYEGKTTTTEGWLKREHLEILE